MLFYYSGIPLVTRLPIEDVHRAGCHDQISKTSLPRLPSSYITCLWYLLLKDVDDVLLAVEHVISEGLAERQRIGVLGGSHGGFLTSHLIGQVKINPILELRLFSRFLHRFLEAIKIDFNKK